MDKDSTLCGVSQKQKRGHCKEVDAFLPCRKEASNLGVMGDHSRVVEILSVHGKFESGDRNDWSR